MALLPLLLLAIVAIVAIAMLITLVVIMIAMQRSQVEHGKRGGPSDSVESDQQIGKAVVVPVAAHTPRGLGLARARSC